MVDRLTGVTASDVDTEYTLGLYKIKDHEAYPKQDEWQHVVNATVPGGVLGGQSKPRGRQLPTAYGGNGAYFFQEYPGGQTCEHPDVTEAAIKANKVGEGGIERAASVRYSCGNQFEMNIKEDSTCHYIVDVTIPALCSHPLFKATVFKKQVVKCLPAVANDQS
jgi:hypothetical protein